jgi:GH35 family endo-1,4-beta-xylanase
MPHLDDTIRQHRTSHATVTLHHQGVPLAHQDVQIEQKNHRFLFGANWGNETVALANGELAGQAQELAEQRSQHFVALFNQATLPFYWARFEPRRGQPDTQRILNVARWYRDHGCAVKGHPLCWHTLAPDWLLPLSVPQILEAQVARIRRDMADFAGVIDTWDIINEAVIMPIFDRYANGITRLCQHLGRIKLIRTVFETARAVNPHATLILNDFDVSPAYDILVEGCLAAGVKMDVIGIQSHMHQGYWGIERTQQVLSHFERFNLPIHFTENTIVSGQVMPPDIVDLNDYQVDEWPSTPDGEERQAQEVVTHYKTLLAHPLVQAITWWDLSDGGWLKAPAGLLRQDQSPKPAYEELLRLIKGEWWLPATWLTTNAAGQFDFSGFLGDYEVMVGGQKIAFSLYEKGAVALSLNV